MKYRELVSKYKNKGIHLKKYGFVSEDKKYDLFKIIINNGSKKSLFIITGFHGEEFNGPISLVNIIDEVIKYSASKKVNLVIYICANPSGFEKHKRYNLSDENQNNDFIRYLVNGEVVGILKSKKFESVKIIDGKAKETRILKNDILDFNIVPVGVIDVHQDDEISKGDFYTYIFDKENIYEKIMKKTDKVALRCRNILSKNFDDDGTEFNDSIDKKGFIKVHDGTLTDMFYQFGSTYSVTIETNVKTKLTKVCKVNKIWIKEMIDLVSKSKKVDKKFKN